MVARLNRVADRLACLPSAETVGDKMGLLPQDDRQQGALVQLDQLSCHRRLPVCNGIYDSIPQCLERR